MFHLPPPKDSPKLRPLPTNSPTPLASSDPTDPELFPNPSPTSPGLRPTAIPSFPRRLHPRIPGPPRTPLNYDPCRRTTHTQRPPPKPQTHDSLSPPSSPPPPPFTSTPASPPPKPTPPPPPMALFTKPRRPQTGNLYLEIPGDSPPPQCEGGGSGVRAMPGSFVLVLRGWETK